MDRSESISIAVVFGGIVFVAVAVFVYTKWEQRKK